MKRKKKEFKPKQLTKLISPKGKNLESSNKWKGRKKTPRSQKVQNFPNKDDKKELGLETKHKGGRKKSRQKAGDDQMYNREFLLDLAPDHRNVEPFVEEQLSNLGIWAQRQRKKDLVLTRKKSQVLTTLRRENTKERSFGRAVDEEISLSSLHSLFHSNRTSITLSFLRQFLSDQREQREGKMQPDSGVQRRSSTPRAVYVRRDPQLPSPSHQLLLNAGHDDNDRGNFLRSPSHQDQRDYGSTNDGSDVGSFAAAAALAASCAAGLDYDNERPKDAVNDHNRDHQDGNDPDAENLHTGGLIDPGFELLSPTSKNRHLEKKHKDLQKQRQEDSAARAEDMKKLKEQFQNINARLQDQLRVVVEENAELTNNLSTVKRKNEKLQARLSMVGEKNLELMEKIEVMDNEKTEREKHDRAPGLLDEQPERRHSKDSEERQPIYPTEEVRHTSVDMHHSMGQPERSAMQSRDIHQNDQPIREDIHSFSMANMQNLHHEERQMHNPSTLGEMGGPQHMDPGRQQNARTNNPAQMMNFGPMPTLPVQPPHYFYDTPPGGAVPPQLGMTNTPFPGMAGMPFQPMMFAPPFTTPYPILPQLNGELLPICITFYGSRHIQNQLENDTDDQRFFAKFFNEVKDRSFEIMTNKFGRFAFEKMLNKCSDEERTILLRNLMPRLAEAACDVHGSFGTQVLVKSLTHPKQIKMVADALKGDILKLITDYKGHYLVIVLIQKFFYEDFKWIDEAVSLQSHTIATNHQGLQVMKALFKNRTTEQILHLLQIIAEQTMELVEDQYGNYIIQTALTKHFDVDGYPHFQKVVVNCKERMLKKMEENFRHLAQQKFSSNVVELCLKEPGFDRWKDTIINELLSHPPVAVKDLINDRYGNYVLQTALAEAHPHQVTLIAERITPHFSCFRVNIRAKWAKLVKAARERTGT